MLFNLPWTLAKQDYLTKITQSRDSYWFDAHWGIFLWCSFVVIGRSTHNQRIERLWRDVYGDCLSLFYQIFQYLEMHNMLDVDDEIHIWCLHMVYLPIINQYLKIWKASWVHHPLCTESNKSPMQLWIGGLHETQFGQAMLRNAWDLVTEVNIKSHSPNGKYFSNLL